MKVVAPVKEAPISRRKRSWKVVKDPRARCLLCGTHKPLCGAHIIPRSILDALPMIDRQEFYDHGGINVLKLCYNHHRLYDTGQLDYHEHLIMMAHANRVVLELNRHISKISLGRNAIPLDFFDQLDIFITTLHQYDNKGSKAN